MTHEYGVFAKDQIVAYKEKMRKKIFFLLLIVDPKTKEEYKEVNVDEAFSNILRVLGGYDELIGHPVEMVTVLSMLAAAKKELDSDSFEYATYRKLILDAGCEVLKIKEV